MKFLIEYYKHFFLIFLLSFASFFATYRISESPPVWYDEGVYQQIALNLSRTGIFAVQIAPDDMIPPGIITIGYPLVYPVSLLFDWFGESVESARVVMALFIVAMILVSFMFIRTLSGFAAGALASVLVVSFPALYGNGKSMLGEIPGLFFLFSFLFFAYRAEQTDYRKTIFYILGGLALGLCVATKPLFILLLPAILLATLFMHKRIVFYWRRIACGAVAFSAPMAVWLVTQFGVRDSFFDILVQYLNPYVFQVGNLSDVVTENFLRLFTETSPIYFSMLFLIWVVAIVLRILKPSVGRISFAETVVFLYAIFVVLAYLRTAGWYRYFFTANIIALLFSPQSFLVIMYAIYEKVPRLRWLHPTATLIIATALLFGVHFYKLLFDSFVARSYHDTNTATYERYFSTLDSQKSIFVYDVPEVVIFLPTRNYYQIFKFGRTIGEEKIIEIERGTPDIIIVGRQAAKDEKELFSLYQEKDSLMKIVILERK